MNKIVSLAIVVVFFAIPAHAQRSLAGAPGPNGAGSGVGGGSASGGAAGSIGGGGTVSFHTLPPIPSAKFQIIDVSGVSSEFVPSSWTQFENGLAQGKAQLALERKTLGEVAAENRLVEKPKAKLAIIQDAFGNAIIQRQ
jgi:hypothetical protein